MISSLKRNYQNKSKEFFDTIALLSFRAEYVLKKEVKRNGYFFQNYSGSDVAIFDNYGCDLRSKLIWANENG